MKENHQFVFLSDLNFELVTRRLMNVIDISKNAKGNMSISCRCFSKIVPLRLTRNLMYSRTGRSLRLGRDLETLYSTVARETKSSHAFSATMIPGAFQEKGRYSETIVECLRPFLMHSQCVLPFPGQ